MAFNYLAQVAYCGGFGVTLMACPQIYYAGGPMVYWKCKFNSSNKGHGEWFANSTGGA
jgi:hypothetical protein